MTSVQHRGHLLADGGDSSDGSESPAAIRHRTLTELRRTVQRHPAVETAYGVRGDEQRFRELEVTLDPIILGSEAASAGLRIVWRPRPDPGETVHFVFHYYDETGRDFGWHREPNDHVQGLEHFQERPAPDADYTYQPTHFGTSSPVALLWDVLGRIEDRLRNEREC